MSVRNVTLRNHELNQFDHLKKWMVLDCFRTAACLRGINTDCNILERWWFCVTSSIQHFPLAQSNPAKAHSRLGPEYYSQLWVMFHACNVPAASKGGPKVVFLTPLLQLWIHCCLSERIIITSLFIFVNAVNQTVGAPEYLITVHKKANKVRWNKLLL